MAIRYNRYGGFRVIMSLLTKVKEAGCRGWQTAAYYFGSETDVTALSKKVNDLATEGLKNAKDLGIKTDSVKGNLLSSLNHQKSEKAKNGHRPVPVGQIARIPNANVNPSATMALPLQMRNDLSDWDKKTEDNQIEFTKKLTAYLTFRELRDRSEMKDIDDSEIMQLVQVATHKGEKRSLWEIFTTHFDNHWSKTGWWQYIKAGFFYWFYYKSSLVTNTIEAYLKAFIDRTRRELSTKDDKNRQKAKKSILDNAKNFLDQDFDATKAYANAETPVGTLDDYRNRTIENHFGNLQELCETFSENRVDEDSPIVPFFRDLQEIPVIGWIFSGLEWCINRYIIQRAMKYSILPPALVSMIENGIDAAHPSNLPFTLALTRFLNKNIEQLMHKMDTEPPAIPPTKAEMDMLSPVIKNLLKVLNIESCETRDEIRKNLNEKENTKIKKDIETGIVEGCHSLFAFLQESALSGELFYILTDLALTPFSEEIYDTAVLKSLLDEEQAKLKRVSNNLFDKILERVVEKHVGGKTDPYNAEMALDAFDDGIQVSISIFKELTKFCEKIESKFALGEDIQAELASLFQIMEVFISREEFTTRIEKFEPKQREAIWRTMTPLYKQLEKIAKTALELQDLQNYYSSHTNVVNQARFVQEILSSVRTQFLNQPRHFQNPFVQTLKKVYADIEPSLGKEAPNTIQLKQYIHDISKFSDSMAKQQRALDALYVLYPPREGHEDASMGLVDQLLQYEKGNLPGFQPRACLKEIAKLLPCFSAPEQLRIKQLIEDGSNLSKKWDKLTDLLKAMLKNYSSLQKQDRAAFDQVLTQSEQWAGEMQVTYDLIAKENDTQLRKNVTDLGAAIEQLNKDATNAKLHLPFELSQILQTVAGGGLLGGTALALTLPPTVPIIGTAAIGLGIWKGKSVTNKALQWYAKPEITKVFNNACKLMHSPRIYYAASTRALKVLS